MFKKFVPGESTNGMAVIKSSAQRAILSKIQDQYPLVSAEQLELVLPKKDAAVLVKCVDHIAILETQAEKAPLFFNQRDGPFYPTLRLLHKLGDVMQTVYVDAGAIKPLINGAELMCPGIQKDKLGEFEADTPVQIMAEGKTLPFAVGITKMSSKDIAATNSGVGVEILHTLGDGLWVAAELDN